MTEQTSGFGASDLPDDFLDFLAEAHASDMEIELLDSEDLEAEIDSRLRQAAHHSRELSKLVDDTVVRVLGERNLGRTTGTARTPTYVLDNARNSYTELILNAHELAKLRDAAPQELRATADTAIALNNTVRATLYLLVFHMLERGPAANSAGE